MPRDGDPQVEKQLHRIVDLLWLHNDDGGSLYGSVLDCDRISREGEKLLDSRWWKQLGFLVGWVWSMRKRIKDKASWVESPFARMIKARREGLGFQGIMIMSLVPKVPLRYPVNKTD